MVASMKQEDIEKAMAIVSIFETGKPRGNYAALAVLNDGAGISYGIKQFTHRSGSLLQVVEKYLATDATAGRGTIESRPVSYTHLTLPTTERASRTASSSSRIARDHCCRSSRNISLAARPRDARPSNPACRCCDASPNSRSTRSPPMEDSSRH